MARLCFNDFFACACLLRALSKTSLALALNQTQHCKQLEGLVVSQVQLCRSNLELMQTIIQAAREVIKTCRKTFSDMRWNCSSIELAPNYLLDLDRGKTALLAHLGLQSVESACLCICVCFCVCVCVLEIGRVMLLGGHGGTTKPKSLLVLFSETTFIIMVPVMPRGSWIQDLVYHNSYKAGPRSGLLIPLGVMGGAKGGRRVHRRA